MGGEKNILCSPMFQVIRPSPYRRIIDNRERTAVVYKVDFIPYRIVVLEHVYQVQHIPTGSPGAVNEKPLTAQRAHSL